MGKTAFKTNIDEPQYALGNYGYFSGRHYFEINLLTDPMIRSVVVGLYNIIIYILQIFKNFMDSF